MPPNPTGPTNEELRMLIRFLRRAANEYKAKIWDYVADLLERPTRQRVEVNIGKINRLVNDGDVVVVPGKVLGSGVLTKKVTIAAWAFSKGALEAIRKAGAEAITIPELVRRNNRGSNVKIII
ncbi:MAG: 50S ribosomal protein L18e [Vulcanisaeta sp.]|jgi:large subunit ribosomal protein L18e|nr:50S ribosomal protein L18e [Vulcanisaeta sp.]MCG2870059.1 50S ribosomal protein L18e [Vulcanisaeta sp.]MCG2879977.1 50S ribosomal protein L18e [Vulcanisaeta sp.]MCG2887011.1 50S ribosomal protein L18e [Vulcanisaeta sp.]MCG2892448.1 50S ribosomal protein L18e [Vulcanisaeta sp.]